uniref:Uncharacterized protein n=1 Tax=Chromera velia CCMP2878 TaxID=1169474 RepID=A0A0G4IA62_9ALVE|eukprot:Cvel_12356.t1-p1 / transcript=Cvel_12356.t1 / gene=Cvel_12356 / organism=Chromera_velia_CCMP2878 / gene_product=hypothetical protein / transcript_product=hypothetical protein / location=Cvel_scaffold804:39881-42136(+) / protein_length=213 / sequence_SO=supercontig / SO=protein_coding / is_pseudo=false
MDGLLRGAKYDLEEIKKGCDISAGPGCDIDSLPLNTPRLLEDLEQNRKLADLISDVVVLYAVEKSPVLALQQDETRLRRLAANVLRAELNAAAQNRRRLQTVHQGSTGPSQCPHGETPSCYGSECFCKLATSENNPIMESWLQENADALHTKTQPRVASCADVAAQGPDKDYCAVPLTSFARPHRQTPPEELLGVVSGRDVLIADVCAKACAK